MTVTRPPNQNLLTASCAASAGIHAGLVPSHLGESAALGLAFIAAALAMFVVALAVSVGPPTVARTAAPAAGALLAALMASYAISRTVGLPLGHEGVEELDGLGLLTQCIQVVGLGVAVRLIWSALAT